MKPGSRRVSVAQYAKHCGVSRQAVYRALGEGRIDHEPDGSIDPDRADAMWAANTLPTMWPADGEDVVLTDADLERLLDG